MEWGEMDGLSFFFEFVLDLQSTFSTKLLILDQNAENGEGVVKKRGVSLYQILIVGEGH